jgi:Protein of unknown function (DUF1493)
MKLTSAIMNNNAKDVEAFVVSVLSRRSGVRASDIHLSMYLQKDLLLTGDDATDALSEISRATGMTVSTFNPNRHFKPEPTLRSLVSKLRFRPVPESEPLLDLTIRDILDAVISGHLTTP